MKEKKIKYLKRAITLLIQKNHDRILSLSQNEMSRSQIFNSKTILDPVLVSFNRHVDKEWQEHKCKCKNSNKDDFGIAMPF